MNYISNIFQNIKNVVNIVNNNINLLEITYLFVPLYYANYISSSIYITYSINNLYLFYLYSNKDILINTIFNKCNNTIIFTNSNYSIIFSILFININIIYILLYTLPLLYILLYRLLYNYSLLQSIYITNIYLYELIKNKDYILELLFKYLKYGLLFILDNGLSFKIIITNYYKSLLNNNFIISNVYLYTDLNNKINVTKYFKDNILLNKIDRDLIDLLYIKNNITTDKNNDTRLKIYFKFRQIDYIIYFPYKIIIDGHTPINLDLNNYYLPIPIYTDAIIDNLKNDIILPHYNKEKDKKEFYSLFQMESKDILLTCINNIHDYKLFEYFNLIKTPFNDFGILYNVPVKLHWILVENNIEIETFEHLYFKFLSVYFCEKEFDIKEHFIKFDNNDLDKIFISERMKEILV
jgi:hypothetical protein